MEGWLAELRGQGAGYWATEAAENWGQVIKEEEVAQEFTMVPG